MLFIVTSWIDYVDSESDYFSDFETAMAFVRKQKQDKFGYFTVNLDEYHDKCGQYVHVRQHETKEI